MHTYNTDKHYNHLLNTQSIFYFFIYYSKIIIVNILWIVNTIKENTNNAKLIKVFFKLL